VLIGIVLTTSWLSAQFEPFQREEQYQVFMDLKALEDDQIPVQLVSPILNVDTVEYHMARIIPGTYDVHNYGRFISDFIAISGAGDTLEVNKLDINRWQILGARDLYKITYKVDDTYDYPEQTGIFEPAGTGVSDSVFLLNNFAFIGYLDGYQKLSYDLEIAKPKGFYGSTALVGEIGEDSDRYTIDNYFELHDNPMLYCLPDTVSRMVGNTRVLVSVYSPNKLVNAAQCMEDISAVLDATEEYLGGELPVEKYAVLIYTVPMNMMGSSYGALEHHRSTVLYMPEMEGEEFYSSVRDVTSHEFFHIITPLNIHSEMIADFDFIHPEMSEHIWLYEGVTEYNSHLVQIRSGIYTLNEFLSITRDKMTTADDYDTNIPLTVSSKHTLTFLKDQYYDFYQKGHLAGMALDLKLIQLSDGDYRLVDLLQELGEVYGSDTFFVDDNLFDIITELTYPEMREFFARHFEGAEPFPFEELLAMVGIVYQAEAEIERFTVGNIEFGYNFGTGRLKVAGIDEMDAFGKDMGWQEGDELIEFNGTPVDLYTISDVISDFYSNTEVGDKVEVLIARPSGEDEFKEKKLKAKARTAMYPEYHIIQAVPEPSESQVNLRKVWINQ
jgi:predicted metalloprotease with PDZ domain